MHINVSTHACTIHTCTFSLSLLLSVSQTHLLYKIIIRISISELWSKTLSESFFAMKGLDFRLNTLLRWFVFVNDLYRYKDICFAVGSNIWYTAYWKTWVLPCDPIQLCLEILWWSYYFLHGSIQSMASYVLHFVGFVRKLLFRAD